MLARSASALSLRVCQSRAQLLHGQKMNRLLALKPYFTNPARPAIRETSAYAIGTTSLMFLRPCGRRGHQLVPPSQDIRIADASTARPAEAAIRYRERGTGPVDPHERSYQSCRHKGIRVIDIVTSILRASRQGYPRPLGQPRAVNNYESRIPVASTYQNESRALEEIVGLATLRAGGSTTGTVAAR